jgi:Protein of unknown function (DUF4245)
VSEQAGRYQRSFGGMLAALLVLGLVVVGYVVIRALVLPDHDTSEPTVDYAQVVPPARKAADFDLVAPTRLPNGWSATSVRFDPGPPQHWHLGVLTPEQRYVGLEQGDRPVAEMLDEYVDKAASRQAATDVAGRTWSTYTDAGGDLAFVRRSGTATTLVVGHDVSRSQLESYVASLR